MGIPELNTKVSKMLLTGILSFCIFTVESAEFRASSGPFSKEDIKKLVESIKFPLPEGSSHEFRSDLTVINQVKPIFEFISEEILAEINNQRKNNEKTHPVHRRLKFRLDSSTLIYERLKDYFQFYAINYSGAITSKNVKYKLEWYIPRRIDIGYARIRLNHDIDTSNTYLEEELSVPVDNNNYYFDIKVRSPIRFVNSNWAQYLAGHTVSARYTTEGLAKVKIEMETQINNYLTRLLDSVLIHRMNDELSKFNFEIKVEQEIPNYQIEFDEHILFMKSDDSWQLSINISAIPIE